jgi:hypothetical protein
VVIVDDEKEREDGKDESRGRSGDVSRLICIWAHDDRAETRNSAPASKPIPLKSRELRL